jgi:hypothetical protein
MTKTHLDGIHPRHNTHGVVFLYPLVHFLRPSGAWTRVLIREYPLHSISATCSISRGAKLFSLIDAWLVGYFLGGGTIPGWFFYDA